MNDHQLQQRLLEAEVPPPAGVWNSLAAALDEMQELGAAAQQLRSAERTPPEIVWANIKNQLDEEENDSWVHDVLKTAEIHPPSTNWLTIEERLSEEVLGQQLTELQMPVPGAAWENITQQLEREPGSIKKVPVLRLQQWLRLAAAAIVTGLLLWGGNLLLHVDDEKNQTPPVTQGKQPVSPPVNPVTPAVEPNIESPVRLAKKQVAKKKTALTTGITNPLEAPEHDDELFYDESIVAHRLKRYEVTNDNPSFEEGNYLVLLDENGELVRVSKRLIQMKCVDGNDQHLQVEATAALQARNCENLIKKWQEKIAQSAVLSAGGYFDLREVNHTTEK